MGGREGARVCARAQRTTQQQPQPWRPSASLCLIPLSVVRRRRGFPFFFSLSVYFLSKSTNAPSLTAYLWTSPRLVRLLPIRRRSTGKRAEWEELKGEHDWGERPETDCEAAHPSLSLIQTRISAVLLRPGIPRLPGSLGVLSHVVPESVSVSVSTREPPVLTCVNPEAPCWLARSETPFFSQLSPAAVAGTHGDRGSLFSFLIVCLHVCGLSYHQKTMVLKVKRWQPPIFHFLSSVRGEPLFTEMVR